MPLRFVVPEGGGDILQWKAAVDDRLQAVDLYRTDHVLLVGFAADGNSADADLV
ncbi:hypothetical protein X757_28515 [Mesorhizobium sp. LSHC414A00]|nr:hypothetical protein X757_28515 [Mesorhizobium sp. LSHC414A00]